MLSLCIFKKKKNRQTLPYLCNTQAYAVFLGSSRISFNKYIQESLWHTFVRLHYCSVYIHSIISVVFTGLHLNQHPLQTQLQTNLGSSHQYLRTGFHTRLHVLLPKRSYINQALAGGYISKNEDINPSFLICLRDGLSGLLPYSQINHFQQQTTQTARGTTKYLCAQQKTPQLQPLQLLLR